MTTTSIDTFVLVFTEDVTPPACEWDEHFSGKHDYRHGGAARFELLFPCGFTSKACAPFVHWLLEQPGAHVSCKSQPGAVHDASSVTVVDL